MAWHDASCADLDLDWEDGRPGCRTCQRRAPELTPIHPIAPPPPPRDTPRSQLVCKWPPKLFFSNSRDDDWELAAESESEYDEDDLTDEEDIAIFKHHGLARDDEEEKLLAGIPANIDKWTAGCVIPKPQTSLQPNQETLQQREPSGPMLNNIHPHLPDPDSIRLLCLHGSRLKSEPIHCTLLVFGLYDPRRPIFEALSYTWADFDGDSTLRKTIFLGPHYDICPVTNNCLAALRHYRTAVDRLIWIDAICINQFDLAERGQQVSLMRDIYMSAARVLMYAGIESATPISLPGFAASEHASSESSFMDVWSILRIPYFSRIWVIQEVQLSRTASLTVGDFTMDWEDFLSHVRSLKADCTQAHSSWVQHVNSNRAMSIMSLLKATRHCRCGDARDRLYGLLGMTLEHERRNLPVDYGISIQQLYTGLAMYWLTKKASWQMKSSILDLACFPKVTPFLPSWVPDWVSLSNMDIGSEGTAPTPLAFEINTAGVGKPSAGLNWFQSACWNEQGESKFKWTLDDLWNPEGIARPLQQNGIMVVDAVHLATVSKGQVQLRNSSGRLLQGMETADSERLLQDDCQLHVLINWNRACILRLHTNKVYSIDRLSQIVYGPLGAPTVDTMNTTQRTAPKVYKPNDTHTRGYYSTRGPANTTFLPTPGFPGQRNILGISELLSNIEAEIVEDWLLSLFFFGIRAGRAFTGSHDFYEIKGDWTQQYPLASTACCQPDRVFDTTGSHEQFGLEKITNLRSSTSSYMSSVAALSVDNTRAGPIALPELLRSFHDKSELPDAKSFDAELATHIRHVQANWSWSSSSMQDTYTYLEQIVTRYSEVGWDHEDDWKAASQITPFLLKISIRTLRTILQSTQSNAGSTRAQEKVPLTVGHAIRNARKLVEDLQIDEKFTLEENFNILWIHVITMEMVARLRAVLQQRLILKAIGDKLQLNRQKIYLI